MSTKVLYLVLSAVFLVSQFMSTDPVVMTLIPTAVVKALGLVAFFATFLLDKFKGDVAKVAGPTVLALCIVGTTGCPQAASVVPSGATLAECIATDASKGASLFQMVEDCGGDLSAVVVAILESVDPAVVNSPAYAEAQKLASKLGTCK